MFRNSHGSFWANRGIYSIEEDGATKVPAEYYDALLAALKEPPRPNEVLTKAVQQRRRFKQL